MRVSPGRLKRARAAAGLSQRDLAARIVSWPGFEGKASAVQVRLSRLETGATRTIDEEFAEALREELDLGTSLLALSGGEWWAWSRHLTSGDYMFKASVGMRYPMWRSHEEALDGRDALARHAPGALSGTEACEEVGDDELYQSGDDYFDEFIGERAEDDSRQPLLWRRLPVLRLTDPDEEELAEIGLFHLAAHGPDEAQRAVALETLERRAAADQLIVPPSPEELFRLAQRRLRAGGMGGYAGRWEPASTELLDQWQREVDLMMMLAKASCAGCLDQ